jgi:hypothetical protein
MLKINSNTLAIIRVWISLSLLFALFLFYFKNIYDIDVGVGEGYFFSFFAGIGVLWLLTPTNYKMIVVNKPIIAIVGFLFYISLRFVLDQQDTTGLFAFMFSTTSGVFFGYILGIFLAYLFLSIVENAYQFPCTKIYFNKAVLVYFVLVTIFIIVLFDHHYANKVSWFSINENPVNYQRPGILLFLLAIQNATLLIVVKLLSPNKKNRLIQMLFYISTLVMIILGQLVGSNFFFLAGIVLLFVVFWHLSLTKSSAKHLIKKEIRLSSFFTGWMGLEIYKIIGAIFLVSILLFVSSVELSIIDFQQLRITGKETYIPSLNVRMDILKDVFILHFNNAPLFGDMFVHEIVNTRYIHSLLRILPSIGITGALFFFFIIFLVYRDIKLYSKMTYRESFNYQVFRLIMVSYILLGAILMAGFSWIPLWFIIGLFSISIFKRPAKL